MKLVTRARLRATAYDTSLDERSGLITARKFMESVMEGTEQLTAPLFHTTKISATCSADAYMVKVRSIARGAMKFLKMNPPICTANNVA